MPFFSSSLRALCLVGMFSLSGCAAIAAFDLGAPNLGALKVGASRAQIEAEFGKPVSRQLVQAGTTVDIYEYTANRNPSIMRGIGHIIADVFTLGIWEYFALEDKVEIIDTHRVRVVYDKDGKLAESRTIESYADDQYFNQEKP